MKSLRIALAAALLTTGTAASAQSATDARCLILSNALANQGKDDNSKKIGESSFYFYLGRIGQNATAAQLKTLFEQQGKTITDATAQNLMTACANSIEEKVKLVQSISSQQQQPKGR